MDLTEYTYVPSIRWRMGEYGALSALASRVKDRAPGDMPAAGQLLLHRTVAWSALAAIPAPARGAPEGPPCGL